MEVEELSGRKLIDGENIITPQTIRELTFTSLLARWWWITDDGAGVVKSMTGESAERAALGAGSIVMDVTSNDGRKPHEDY